MASPPPLSDGAQQFWIFWIKGERQIFDIMGETKVYTSNFLWGRRIRGPSFKNIKIYKVE